VLLFEGQLRGGTHSAARSSVGVCCAQSPHGGGDTGRLDHDVDRLIRHSAASSPSQRPAAAAAAAVVRLRADHQDAADADRVQRVRPRNGARQELRGSTGASAHRVETPRRRHRHRDVTDTDLHTPDTGLSVYAFATPFILIIGNRFANPIDCPIRTTTTRMWANAQRGGRTAKYRWRPLFNAAKFG